MNLFEKHFNRTYTMHEFPYFVPFEELEYNLEYAKSMVDEAWIYHRWRSDIEHGSLKSSGHLKEEATRIAQHGGLILEICAGPGGGFMPAVLLQDYQAHIMISDLCPTVVREWQKLFMNMKNPPPNMAYAAFDVCDMPFEDNALDVISGSGAIVNIEGGAGSRDKALKEIHRVLKPGGLLVFDFSYVSEAHYDALPEAARHALKSRYPQLFWDALDIFDELGYAETETLMFSEYNNENDESTLADYCRSMGVSLTFNNFTNFCIK